MSKVYKKFFENDRIIVINPISDRMGFSLMRGVVSGITWISQYHVYIYTVDFGHTKQGFFESEITKLKIKKYTRYFNLN